MNFDEYQEKAHSFASYSGNAAGLVPHDVLRVLPFGLASRLDEVPEALAEYIRDISTFLYPSSKLAGEAGEVAEKLAKQVRDKGVLRFKDVSPEDREALKKELGDVLWYVSEISHQLGFSLESVAVTNVEKLAGRVERGTLHGDGDDR